MKRQSVQKRQFDKHVRKQDLPHLVKDQKVLIQNQRSLHQEPAVFQSTTANSHSYVVRLPNGTVVRRNRQHIRHLPNVSPKLPPAIQDNARHPQVDLSESGESQVSHNTQHKILNEQPAQSSDTVPHVYRTCYGHESRKPERYSCSVNSTHRIQIFFRHLFILCYFIFIGKGDVNRLWDYNTLYYIQYLCLYSTTCTYLICYNNQFYKKSATSSHQAKC